MISPIKIDFSFKKKYIVSAEAEEDDEFTLIRILSNTVGVVLTNVEDAPI